MSMLEEIRKRVDAQRRSYGFRWNQILKDRANLLSMVENRDEAIENLLRCGQTKPLCESCKERAKKILSGKYL